MKRQTATPPTTEATLLGRIFTNGNADFPPQLARYFLTVGFSSTDKQRMHELAESNQAGALTPADNQELLRYANVGCLLGILQANARKSLKKTSKKPTS